MESPYQQKIQLRFWIAYKQVMDEEGRIPCQKPYPQNWMDHPIGKSGFHLSSVASTWNTITNSYSMPELRVELVLDGKNAKRQFAHLEKRKQEIETSLEVPLTWYNPTNAKLCRIYTRRDADIHNESLWPEQHKWLKDTLELFNNVLKPIVGSLQD